MLIHAIAAVAAIQGAQVPAVTLSHVFAKGEKAAYEVKSRLNSEFRQRGLETYIPEDYDIHYRFSYEVKEMKADGICDMRYLRPTMTEIQGETFERPPRTKVEKVDMDLLLTISPINDVIDVKDLKKKPGALRTVSSFGVRPQLGPIIGQFVGEIQRLALFIGSLDSSMDFAPKLPFDEVAPGDTWKRTVGYSPQKLGAKGEKLAVQRLDYTYTYRGQVESAGKQVHRVTAQLELHTDLAAFVHQTFRVKPEDTGLKEIPLSFKGSIEFDLDLRACRTLSAVATSEGSFRVVSTAFPQDPEIEERFKGRTTMRLLSP